MRHKIVFATNNLHKIEEIQHLLQNRFDLLSLDQLGHREDIPENQDTLEGNALEKARFIHGKYGVDCFADDTGLEIDALGGQPGVYSARYAGPERSSAANIRKVLAELDGVKNRAARFRTIIALIFEGKEYLFEGAVEGEIISQPRGQEGFGYDPVFVPAGTLKTFAEMNLDEKNRISHRAEATKKLAAFLLAGN